ncbi:MAG: multidrug efflux RND transporter permease subunit [Desulfomonilaceae bacterium]|nr:multidrug efflux RND transporter permease subunit [Desulfomonilaceae bacterium]
MKLPHFFIERPIFATVLSLVIVLVGMLSYYDLPVAQYPDVVPPTIVVTTSFPGASADVVAKTVATPLEQEINGVENMLYMESQSTADGSLTLTVTFKLGTDLDQAQVLVQNRVAVAVPRLPEEVRRIGVTTNKRSPDLLLVAHLYSPDNSRDELYMSNYAFIRIRDVLARVDGVGEVVLFGAREYSMRIWLDTGRLAELDMIPGDVVEALRSESVQVAAGSLGKPPTDKAVPFQWTVETKGRLSDPEEFAEIVVKTGTDGRLVRVGDVARVELGALDYSMNSYMDLQKASAIGVFQRPGANAISTTDNVLKTLEELSRDFPPGVAYEVVYNPTVFVESSINAVILTIFEASVFVVLVIFLFLQSWRATIIPIAAIPVSLIGTFALMNALGFSLNTLSLFGLVLAIGIVVDDAIVVVENVARKIEQGLDPKEATHKAMDEVGSALIAMGLVLVAVFVPTTFLGGISGQFYRQFALTVAGSTAISVLVSLTLSPAMCALLLKPKRNEHEQAGRLHRMTLGRFFRGFNWLFGKARSGYTRAVGRIIRVSALGLIVYAILVASIYGSFRQVPTGFIPSQDQGYLIVSIRLPEGASLDRTDEVTRRAAQIAQDTPGIVHTVALAGLSGANRIRTSNAAAIFILLDDPAKRGREGLLMPRVLADLRRRLSVIRDGIVVVIPAPPVRGIGTGGGFEMIIQDRGGLGYEALLETTEKMQAEANRTPGLVQVFTTFQTDNPQVFVDIDRVQARMLDVPLPRIFEAMQVYLGSLYVNDFNFLGRTFRVTAQAQARFREDPEDILALRTRSASGAVVPLASVASIRETTSPARILRYNLFPAAELRGDTEPGFSSGEAISAMEDLAAKTLPSGMSFEWTSLAYQEKLAGDLGIYIFVLSVLFVFLFLAAQYESWLLPLAIILIVPLCLLSSIAGVWIRGMENNLLTQIGFVVLVGLAGKNAILIVEFAKQKEDAGLDRFQAVVEACRLRLRPILMTALAFIFGVVPLVTASGPGYEMRQAVGTAVFSGMVGVTFFGLFLTPVFYVVLRKFARKTPKKASDAS